MEWSWTYVLVQLVGGFLGAHAAAIAAHEHSFGALGHSVVGIIGGGLSGYFLQRLAATVVTASGALNEPRFVEQVIVQGLAGAVAGGIAMFLVAILRHGIEHHKGAKS
jgi:uncharacterized membrane protein YeaQ/YmgE (transglycosylase-associated protein family)